MSESMVRKGKSYPDGEYIYFCGCGFKNPDCPYCYGDDLKRCQEAIKTARGSIYYGLLKTILSHVGQPMVKEFHRIDNLYGKITFVDLGYLSLKFGLNYKATLEYLEEVPKCLPAGTVDNFANSRHKVSDVYKAARTLYAADLPIADDGNEGSGA